MHETTDIQPLCVCVCVQPFLTYKNPCQFHTIHPDIYAQQGPWPHRSARRAAPPWGLGGRLVHCTGALVCPFLSCWRCSSGGRPDTAVMGRDQTRLAGDPGPVGGAAFSESPRQRDESTQVWGAHRVGVHSRHCRVFWKMPSTWESPTGEARGEGPPVLSSHLPSPHTSPGMSSDLLPPCCPPPPCKMQ